MSEPSLPSPQPNLPAARKQNLLLGLVQKLRFAWKEIRWEHMCDCFLGWTIKVVTDNKLGLLLTLLLAVLTLAGAITLTISSSVVVMWWIVILWISRSSPIKKLRLSLQGLVILILAVSLAIPAWRFRNWSVSRYISAERPLTTSELNRWWRNQLKDLMKPNEVSENPMHETVPKGPAQEPSIPRGWRRLSDWQKVTLTARLSNLPKQKLFIFIADSEETLRYAHELKDFFRRPEIGWTVEGPRVAPKDQPIMDFQLSLSDKYWSKEQASVVGRSALALKDDLDFVGIHVQRLVVDSDVYADEIALLIGPTSPHQEGAIIPPLEIRCRDPLTFFDIPTGPRGNAKFARFLTVKPPGGKSNHRFEPGDVVRVFFNLPVTGYVVNKQFNVAVAQRVMVRNDVLDIIVTQPVGAADCISAVFFSDQEFQIRCVDEWLEYRDHAPEENRP